MVVARDHPLRPAHKYIWRRNDGCAQFVNKQGIARAACERLIYNEQLQGMRHGVVRMWSCFGFCPPGRSIVSCIFLCYLKCATCSYGTLLVRCYPFAWSSQIAPVHFVVQGCLRVCAVYRCTFSLFRLCAVHVAFHDPRPQHCSCFIISHYCIKVDEGIIFAIAWCKHCSQGDVG